MFRAVEVKRPHNTPPDKWTLEIVFRDLRLNPQAIQIDDRKQRPGRVHEFAFRGLGHTDSAGHRRAQDEL
jgi:hypothetical protein